MRLQVSSNKRFIVRRDQKDFFWLADTAWELFHLLSREEVILYLDNRACKGFTVVMAVVLAELDGLNTPNFYGQKPLIDNDPCRPNLEYFDHVDWVIDQAAERNMYMAVLPTWGDKVNLRYTWALGPEIFSVENARQYGCFLGSRYNNRHNIIWILGGDRDPDDHSLNIWRSLASGLSAIPQACEIPLMTFHPQPFENGSSSRWFHHDDWLAFNMLQTGHDKNKHTYDQIFSDYSMIPIKPVLDGEPAYEAHPASFDVARNGYTADAEVRKYAYWSLFAGSFGHTYGCHSVWQFFDRGRRGVNDPIYDWKTALDLSGAWQMKLVKQLMTSRPIEIRIPDQSIVAGNPEGVLATRASDGSYAFVYSYEGEPFVLCCHSFGHEKLRYTWFSPRDGSQTEPKVIAKQSNIYFQPPNSGYGNDWILIIDGVISEGV